MGKEGVEVHSCAQQFWDPFWVSFQGLTQGSWIDERLLAAVCGSKCVLVLVEAGRLVRLSLSFCF